MTDVVHNHSASSGDDSSATRPGMSADAVEAGVVSVFQPIVSLAEEALVGAEALARWPGLGNPAPQEMFAQAAAHGRLDHLDQMCIRAALTGALTGGLPAGSVLLINCEPASNYLPRRVNDELLDRAADQYQLVFEITERDLLTHPRTLLAKVDALRSEGFGIALDDLGAHPDSLALLDVLAPEILKLDLALVQHQPRHDQAPTLAAVLAHHERSAAVICAEGIETDDHLEQARAVGAGLGQGFRFGCPGPARPDPPTAWSPPIDPRPPLPVAGTPFGIVGYHAPVRTARKTTLIALSRHIESQARYAADPPMVLTALQRREYFTDDTARRYRDLAAHCPLVAVFGQNLPTDLAPGVRGVSLAAYDQLGTEWSVLILGAHHAAALIAREHHSQPAHLKERDRRFDLIITYDRHLVTAAARNLLTRIH